LLVWAGIDRSRSRSWSYFIFSTTSASATTSVPVIWRRSIGGHITAIVTVNIAFTTRVFVSLALFVRTRASLCPSHAVLLR
jgi:hypothetical protein